MTQLTAAWRTTTVPTTAQPSANDRLAYLLVTATANAAAERAPLNVCLALDRSPSMYQGYRPAMPELQEAAIALIGTLRQGDILSIVVYDGGMNVAFPATRIDAMSIRQAQRAISEIESGDDTCVSGGLRGALQQLKWNHGPNVVSRLILLADGQTRAGDPRQCQRVAEEIGREGIPIYAFGLGSEWQSDLFTSLATATGGFCEYLKDGSHILAAFDDAVKLSQGVVARNATLSLELTPGIRLRRAGQVQPALETETVTSERTISLPLGDLTTAFPTAVLFEVILPYQQPGTYLAGRLMLTATSNSGRPETVSLDVPVTYALDPNPAVNPPVANIVERVTAHRLRTSAAADLASGNVGLATQKLKNASTRLLELGELALARETLALADEVQHQGGVSADGAKSLQHGTRKLTQLLGDLPKEFRQ